MVTRMATAISAIIGAAITSSSAPRARSSTLLTTEFQPDSGTSDSDSAGMPAGRSNPSTGTGRSEVGKARRTVTVSDFRAASSGASASPGLSRAISTSETLPARMVFTRRSMASSGRGSRLWASISRASPSGSTSTACAVS